ncbi:hypothetical protein AS9A_2288 [Hoyosella subflava DQS3-9A1]|uniref:Uncharacterized protein n=1 Tax=Hoyosella subflava (strain DSM 45089 / JCM 17490 / NBRC 109087 / DQS3-9A1) TaxID=443218 RepID=F6ER48_HOYSD|nr:hypothetical protein AS9A_2288 [Hoyosella subflava DQS3-9A1]
MPLRQRIRYERSVASSVHFDSKCQTMLVSFPHNALMVA